VGWDESTFHGYPEDHNDSNDVKDYPQQPPSLLSLASLTSFDHPRWATVPCTKLARYGMRDPR
jgi:hypothetical protein